jgi:hypothetical protein
MSVRERVAEIICIFKLGSPIMGYAPPEISISEFEGLKEDISNICKQALLGQGGEK